MPPNSLLARIRWLFLLCSIFNLIALLPLVVFRSPSPVPIRIAGVFGIAVITIYWIRSYRCARFLSGGYLLETVALLVVCGSLETPDQALGAIYCGLYFRGLYGSWRSVAPTIIVFGASYFGSQLANPAVRTAPSEAIQQAIGFFISASVMALVSSFGGSHERAAIRERALARAGAGLVAATSRDVVAQATMLAVRELLSETPVSRVSVTAGYPGSDEQVVLASEGQHAEKVHGLTVHMNRVPTKYRVAQATRQVVMDTAALTDLEAALGVPLHPGMATLTPLNTATASIGLLVVESPRQLPAECSDGLETLGAEVALALENVRLTEDLLHDIAQRTALEQELAHRAFHDPLTELPNRALLVERLQHALARTARGLARPAVAFVDLDDFKLINDSLGHKLGDELLATISQRLRAAIRPGDTAARLGGDEFVILLEDIVDAQSAIAVVERLLTRLQAPLMLDGHEVYVGASVGLAFAPAEGALPDDLLRQADVAMYAAKRNGKRRFVVFDASLEDKPLERLALEADLRRAVERDELRLYYQPIVELDRNRLSGVEALVRWQHPTRGLVPPMAFIPLAEANGLIVQIGRWVLREACVQMKTWYETHPGMDPLVVSVNLSARQFLDPTLVQDLERVLHETGLDPAFLRLEITESTAMEAGAGTIATLQALKGLGVQLAIDDFGTGYSSLSYLKRFPVDTLKIDRSFVHGIGLDSQDTAIVKSVIALAQTLDLKVTAEGIETIQQLDELVDLTCDEGQGYLFAKPQPSLEAAILRRWSLPEDEAQLAA
jgi:diguanylate cyclase (GGDEF)-like protein